MEPQTSVWAGEERIKKSRSDGKCFDFTWEQKHMPSLRDLGWPNGITPD